MGEIGVDDLTGETAFARLPWTTDVPTGANLGVLELTAEADDSLGGAEYIHTIGKDRTNGAFIQYGFYQYYSFTDHDGVEVEVLVTAASFDYDLSAAINLVAPATSPISELSDEEVVELVGETITSETVEPLALIDHERVQSRFECVS